MTLSTVNITLVTEVVDRAEVVDKVEAVVFTMPNTNRASHAMETNVPHFPSDMVVRILAKISDDLTGQP